MIKKSACYAGDLGWIPGLGRSPRGGHGNPLQYSCLENPHGQRSLVGYSRWGRKESDKTERLSAFLYVIQMKSYRIQRDVSFCVWSLQLIITLISFIHVVKCNHRFFFLMLCSILSQNTSQLLSVLLLMGVWIISLWSYYE